LLSSTLSTFESEGKSNVRIGKRTPGAGLLGDEEVTPPDEDNAAGADVVDMTVLVPGGDANGPRPVLAFGLSATGGAGGRFIAL